jgi:hypothetical protein
MDRTLVTPAPAMPMLPALTTINISKKTTAYELKTEITNVRYTEYSVWSYKSRKSEESKLDTSLQKAIKTYTGPLMKISSGKRYNGYKKSLHRCGKAIDASYDRKVVNWLLSPQGKEWALENKVRWFTEDNKKRQLPNFRLIPWATSIHIHIEIKHG